MSQRTQYKPKPEFREERHELKNLIFSFINDAITLRDQLDGADSIRRNQIDGSTRAVRDIATFQLAKPNTGTIHPLVFLDSLAEVVTGQKSDTTLAYKLELINAASLVWAEALDNMEEELADLHELSDSSTSELRTPIVSWMLIFCDMEKQWGGRGKKSAKRLKADWKESQRLPIPSTRALQKMTMRLAIRRRNTGRGGR